MRKSERILDLFFRLMNDEVIKKKKYAAESGVSIRTVERYLNTIEKVLDEENRNVKLSANSYGEYSIVTEDNSIFHHAARGN